MATTPVGPTVTPLRQRMLDDMAMRSMRARTQHDYVRHVRAFAAFLRRSPETATAEDVRRFQLHQREHGVGESVIGATVSALRFLFGVTLDRPDLSRKLVLAPRPRKLPDVLSVEEVGRLLEAAPGIKYRAALGVAYGAGLRVSEVAHLKADDIDSKRMLIRIEEGKGRKDRNAMLSPHYSSCSGCGGARASGAASCCRTAGCFPVVATPTRSRPGSCTAPSMRLPRRPASASGSARTHCGTALRRSPDEFIRRFLLHVLPKGFHRIRHYGLLAGANRKAHLERARELLGVAPLPIDAPPTVELDDARPPCPCCGGRMLVIETFERWQQPRAPPQDATLTGTTTS